MMPTHVCLLKRKQWKWAETHEAMWGRERQGFVMVFLCVDEIRSWSLKYWLFWCCMMQIMDKSWHANWAPGQENTHTLMNLSRVSSKTCAELFTGYFCMHLYNSLTGALSFRSNVNIIRQRVGTTRVYYLKDQWWFGLDLSSSRHHHTYIIFYLHSPGGPPSQTRPSVS